MNIPKPKFSKIIPSNPGYFVLTTITDDHGYPIEVDKAPVVAWALESDSLAPYPVTREGVQSEVQYILEPHGVVERAWIDGFLNVDDWLKSQQDDYIGKHGVVK
jgi:hypothetical protein